MKKLGLFGTLIALFLFIGWCKCVYKMATCNWEPIGKAEAFYTVGTFTGLGGIFGWINIKDK